jgi:hypothetical protein
LFRISDLEIRISGLTGSGGNPVEMSFTEFNEKNPCTGCPAPCCQMQLIPFKVPATFMDIDYLRYMLLFPRTEFSVTLTGEWSIIKWEDCREFDAGTHTCKLHNTAAKPRICAMYNPYNCWYKKSFVLNDVQQVYRMDLERFNTWVDELKFAPDGKITQAPDFERSVEVLKDIPIEPIHLQTVEE